MTKQALREKVMKVIEDELPWTEEDCYIFADKIIKVIPQQEPATAEGDPINRELPKNKENKMTKQALDIVKNLLYQAITYINATELPQQEPATAEEYCDCKEPLINYSTGVCWRCQKRSRPFPEYKGKLTNSLCDTCEHKNIICLASLKPGDTCTFYKPVCSCEQAPAKPKHFPISACCNASVIEHTIGGYTCQACGSPCLLQTFDDPINRELPKNTEFKDKIPEKPKVPEYTADDGYNWNKWRVNVDNAIGEILVYLREWE